MSEASRLVRLSEQTKSIDHPSSLLCCACVDAFADASAEAVVDVSVGPASVDACVDASVEACVDASVEASVVADVVGPALDTAVELEHGRLLHRIIVLQHVLPSLGSSEAQ